MRIACILCTSFLLTFGSVAGLWGQERVSIVFHNEPLGAALDSLMKWYDRPIVYLDSDVARRRTSASCSQCNFEAALAKVLDGSGLSWLSRGSQVIIKRTAERTGRVKSRVVGTVSDAVSRDWIVGATVILREPNSPNQTYRWCYTNEFGFFSLQNVVPGTYVLAVRMVGYRTSEAQISVPDELPVRSDVAMIPEEIQLQGITVEAQHSTIVAIEGISHGRYIRATPADQNQYVLDGARIYNPAHFGGILSTFNEEATEDVQVHRGGMPPFYGGRLGGILEATTREGSNERFSGSLGSGSHGSHALVGGPFIANSSFMISGRVGYPDALLPSIKKNEARNHLHSSEVVGKISFRFGDESRMFLSGYLGRDSYTNQVAAEERSLLNDLEWRNGAVNLRWIGTVSPSLFFYGSAGYTRYEVNTAHLLAGDHFLHEPTRLASGYSVEDIFARAHAEHFYDEDHTLRAGVELVHHSIFSNIDQFSSQMGTLLLDDHPAGEFSVYLQNQWRMSPMLMTEIGARATSFVGGDASFSGVDPRFSLLVAPNDRVKVYASLTSIWEFLHPYRHSGIFLFYPTVFWYPSTERFRPSSSMQISLGVETHLGENDYVFAASPYYRITKDLHEFGFDTEPVPTRSLAGVVSHGTGQIYGAEVSFRKRTGQLQASVNYMLTWARHQFAELNGGLPYEPRFVRRHEVQLAAWQDLGPNWTLGFLSAIASDQSPSFKPQYERGPREMDPIGKIIDLNGSRLPGFQRLEFRLSHRFSSWGLPTQVSLRLLNAYGLFDPYDWQLRDDEDMRLKWTATLREQKLFPLYPTASLTVRF